MRWPWRRREQPRNTTVSISDPRLAALFNVGPANYSGADVTEDSALGIAAFFRAVALIAGTIAQLPLRAVRDTASGPVRARSVFDQPGGPDGPTPYEWAETAVLHALLHGNTFLRPVRNGAGGLYALPLIHPTCVAVRLPDPTDRVQPVGGKWFDVSDPITGQTTTHDATSVVHIPALSTDGVYGRSVLTVARNSLGVAISGERASARLFDRGALMGGVASPDDDLDDDELAAARIELNKASSGWENAGGIAVVNRKLNLSPWTMTARDAEFLASRQFSVEEIARWTGVPPHLLMQTEKQTSWGTGVAEQNRGLGRFTLSPWTVRFEQRLSRLVPGRRVEFDYSRLERPNVETDTGLVLQLVAAGLLTVEEGRRRLGLDDGGGAGSAV